MLPARCTVLARPRSTIILRPSSRTHLHSQLLSGAQVVLAGVVTVALVALAACGLYVRYTADDFTMATLLRSHGFIGAQTAQYTGWTGRFAANAAWSAALTLGPWFAQALPALLLVLWGAVLWWTLSSLATLLNARLSRFGQLLAVEVLLFATLATTPNLFSSFYWLTGALTYTAPLIVATAALGVGLHAIGERRLGVHRAVLLAALAAAAIAFSDTYAGVQPVILVWGMAMLLALRRRPTSLEWRVTAVAAAGTVIGLVILLAAPGNAVREATLPPHPAPTFALWRAALDATRFASHAVVQPGLPLLLVAVGFFALGGRCAQRATELPLLGLTWRRTFAAATCLAVLLVATQLPAELALGTAPPVRSQLIPSYVFVLVLAFVAWCAGVSAAEWLRSGQRFSHHAAVRRVPIYATMFVVAGPIGMIASVASHQQAMAAYAAAKDRQWRQALASPGHDIVVDVAPTTELGPLSYDQFAEQQLNPDHPNNRNFAAYFGLHSVRIRATAASGRTRP